MDLLGNLGDDDQLTSAREENKVLKARVKELAGKVKILEIENASLLVEVEMYRKEAVLPSFSKMDIGGDTTSAKGTEEEDFISSGLGKYPDDVAVTLSHIHGNANPLCCALNVNDTLLATGGADSNLVLCLWGMALAPTATAVQDAIQRSASIYCPAPVISVAFPNISNMAVVACGCMDGSLVLAGYAIQNGTITVTKKNIGTMKHGKYVKCMAWSPSSPILASGAADGTVHLSRVSQDGGEMEKLQTLHLTGAVEAMVFLQDDNSTLCLYERGTHYLSYFDLQNGCKLTKFTVNGDITGGFDEHVSFSIMDMALSPNGKYICAATDSHRNIIFQAKSSRQIRNLYGHKNDGFSQPRIAWSYDGQYIFGNTQEDCSICVWDIASSEIIQRLEHHSGQIRDLSSSRTSDTLLSASYDKSIKVWLTK